MPCSRLGHAERPRRRRVLTRIAWIRVVVCGLAGGSACAGAADAVDRWHDLSVPARCAWRAADPDARVAFRGVVRYDGAGSGPQGMLYPAPNAVGLLAAILTHAAINKGVRSAEIERIEAAAQQVVLPLQPALDAVRLRAIQEAALQRLPENQDVRFDDGAGGERPWTLEVAPVFLVSADRRALLLDAVVTVRDASTQAVVTERAVRVVSPALRGAEPVDVWLAGGPEAATSLAASLLAEALRTVLEDARIVPPPTAQRTVRYAEGTLTTAERGVVLAERCGRTVLRTLRDALMSVPVGAAAGTDEACQRAWPRIVAYDTQAAPSPAVTAQPSGEAPPADGAASTPAAAVSPPGPD